MNYKNILALTFFIFVLGVFVLLEQKPWEVGATVAEITDGSFATSTYYASVSSQANSGCVLLKGVTNASIGTGRVSGVLENLIVPGGPKGGTIQFYDATTSNSSLRFGNQASSTILLEEFPAGIATTTYEMNRSFGTGLLMCVVGTPSTSTVTWK